MRDFYSRKIRNRRFLLGKKKDFKRKKVKKYFSYTIRYTFCLLIILVTSTLLNYLGNFIIHSPYFALKDIRFEGCRKVSPQELMKLAEIRKGANIFAINLTELAQRLKFNPWIKEAKIERIFPYALKIIVNERTPVALVSHKKLFFVDKEGVLFKEVEPNDNMDMPVITGLSSSELRPHILKNILDLLDTADQIGVLPKDMVSEVHIDSNYGLTLYTLQDATPIRLGFRDYRKKLNLLTRIREDLYNRKIRPKAIDFVSSDMAHVRLASSS